MTTAKKTSDEPPVDQVDQVDAPAPASGTVVRLDDPEQGGEPVLAIACGDGYVVRLGAASRYDLPTYSIG